MSGCIPRCLAARRRGLLVLFAVSCLPVLGRAASLPSPTQPVGREDGEEEQIEQRENWFRSRRAFGQVARPELARAAAVAMTRTAMARQRAVRPPGVAAATWQAVGPAPMTMLSWTMGQVAGRVEALAVHPDDDNILYLGTASGGVWKTLDGGQHWLPIFDQVGTTTIGAIHLSAADPNIVWVGTGEHTGTCQGYFGLGLFRSSDGGVTWQPRNGSGTTRLDLSYIAAVEEVADDQAGKALLAGGNALCNGTSFMAGGGFRSTDDGASWTRVLDGRVSDLVVDPTDAHVVFAAVGRLGEADGGIYRSADGGKTWSRLTGGGLPTGAAIYRARLAMAPSDHLSLYALIYQSDAKARVWRSLDGGATWSNQTPSGGNACQGQCTYDLCLAVHPTTPSTLLVGSIRFARSLDAGVNLSYLTTAWGSGQKVHQDTHVLRYSRSNPLRFWVGSDGGLWRTDDGGSNFVNLNAGLAITQLYDVALRPDDPDTVFGGAQDNSSSRRVGDPIWDVTIVTGDGFNNLVDPGDPRTVFQSSYPSGGFPSPVRSLGSGAPNTFSWVPSTGLVQNEGYSWQTPMAIADPGVAASSLVFLSSNRVYRALADQSLATFTWMPITGQLTPFGSVTALEALPSGGGIRVYVGTTDPKLYRIDAAEAPTPTVTEVTNDFPTPWGVFDLAANPGDPAQVYAVRGTFSQGFGRSLDGGGHWEVATVGQGLPTAPTNAVLVDPTAGQRIFVGTDVGVFVSEDYGVHFEPLMDGLPIGVPVVDLEATAAPHVLVAATYGRGAFRLDLDQLRDFADGFETGSTSRWNLSVGP